jgi:hypothetical protein
MVTDKQKNAAKANIKKAQAKWKSMTKRQHSLAQPEGRMRKKPGTTGKGKFYHIEVRPKGDFKTFRMQDVGEKGGLERLAGRRSSGSWDTVSWLVSKDKATVKNGKLVITNPKDRTVLKSLSGPIVHVKGDIFKSHPVKNVPENAKPTIKQRKAQMANIKLAQQARKKKIV